jgi:hypothetical protein
MALREFAGKGLICLTLFAAKRRLHGEIDEIPGSTGKTGNFVPTGNPGPFLYLLNEPEH